MAWKEWSDGEVLYAADLNGNFNSIPEVFQISTTSDLDGSDTGLNTFEETFELDAIAGDETIKYVKVEWNVYCSVEGYDGQTGTIYWKLRHKETGDAYADVFGYQILCAKNGPNNLSSRQQVLVNAVWYYTPDAGEKTNGFQLELGSKGTGGASAVTDFACTNRQIIVTIIRTSD